MSFEELSYVKIFPSIGIARVGDSLQDYFVGPELEPGDAVQEKYRDADGRIRRQAARFRIYGFKADGTLIRELTADDAKIEWTAHLANKKAAWFGFQGATAALAAFRGEALDKLDPRNHRSGFGDIEVAGGKYESDERRRSLLEIDGGQKTISGRSASATRAPDPERYRFRGRFMQGLGDGAGKDVYLGELATDDDGRLIVLGGHGVSEPVDGEPVTNDYERQRSKIKHWITHYANNDFWHDDTSDGPIHATVTLESGTRLDAVNGAWVIVAPPDFAPEITNLVTLYDVMEEVSFAEQFGSHPGHQTPLPHATFDFEAHIRPMLERVNAYRWVSPVGLRGHGQNKPGEMRTDELNGKGREAATERHRIFSFVRQPIYEGIDPTTGKRRDARAQTKRAVREANYMFMPPLSGDEGDCQVGNPWRWLTVTHLQYARLERWANDGTSVEEGYPNPELPHRLTRNALLACSGGAFFPGIEMTAIARDPNLYCEPFRIDHKAVSAGDITKYMACPWQADFFECREHWWPAQRPDAVITETQFKHVVDDFDVDRRAGIEKALFSREQWDRGLNRRPWPDRAYVKSLIVPRPDESVAEYVRRIAEVALDAFASLSLTVARKDRIANPWRCQYILQSRLDQLSGRYFVPEIPDVEEAFEQEAVIEQVSKALGRDVGNALEDLRSLRERWPLLTEAEPKFALAVTRAYVNYARGRLATYFEKVIRGHWDEKDVKSGFLGATSDPQEFPEEFPEGSEAHCTLCAGEFRSKLVSALFLEACEQQGDMAMVDGWKNLGFVRSRKLATTSDPAVVETLFVETERTDGAAMTYREHFYRLMNDENFPDHAPLARRIVEDVLAGSQRLIDFKLTYDASHPEAYVPYTPEAFREKLDEIYELLRADAASEQQFVYKTTRDRIVAGMVGNAPFNQVDGAWLRSAADAGPMTEVTSLLFEIWSDEVGNGDPALHHGNLYTTLLRQLGALLPAVNSKEYAEHPALDESTFIAPVFELAISKYTKDYLPEILGMTLFLEWEVLSLVPPIRVGEYFGIDTQFYKMHVGIDNASDGHGAKARDAVISYLDRAFDEGGAAAQQEQWRRIWRGFVAFATAGYDQFGSFEPQANSALVQSTVQSQMPRTPEDDVAKLIERKLPRGALNHLQKQLSIHRINDLFSDPPLFMEELAHSPWVSPGRPGESRLLSYLTTFSGPMYKVFNAAELDVWKRWIEWLGEEGRTNAPRRFLSRCEAMLLLISEMQSQMIGSPGHKLYRARVGKGAAREPRPLAEIFSQSTPAKIMDFLADEAHGYVVRYQPAKSALIVDLLRPGREMGKHLDRRFPALHNQIGRMVVYEWIAAGCPTPSNPNPSADPVIVTRRRPKRLLMQQYGMGAVH